MSEGLGLFGKLAEVMGEVGYVTKRGFNDFQKYKYVTEADLIDEVRDKLVARGVMLMPKAEEIITDGALLHVRMKFLFVDAESGQQFETEWFGSGTDKGDKALYKAYTGALKYFLMKTFLIPTGDDPEADTSTDRQPSRAQAVTGPENGSQGLPERYVDWLRGAIRGYDSGELRDDAEWAKLVASASTEKANAQLVKSLEAALEEKGGDPSLVRERFKAFKEKQS